MGQYLTFAKDDRLKQRAQQALAALATSSEFESVRIGLLDPSVNANDMATRLADGDDPDIPKRSGASLAILEFVKLVDSARHGAGR
jgi:hypothetical protein